MKKIKILTFTAITVLVIVSLIAPSAFAATVPTFTLSYSSIQIPIMLPAGTVFNGSISTTGAVRFWVTAPSGAQTVSLGIIDENAAFGFVAQENGNYTLNFENDVPTSVQVSFSYVTDPDVSGGNSSTGTPLSYLIISIIIAVVGSILIIVFVRRKSRKLVSTSYEA